jgi:hypothetical protein
MMLTHSVDVEADLLGSLGFLDYLPEPLCVTDRRPGMRIGHHVGECGYSEFDGALQFGV